MMTLQGALVFIGMTFGFGIGFAFREFKRDWTARRRSAADKLMLIVAWPILVPRYAREDGEPAALAGRPLWVSTTGLSFCALVLLASGWAAGWLLTMQSAWYDIQRHAREKRVDEVERDADTLARFVRWAPAWYPTMKPVIAEALGAEAAYRPTIRVMRIRALIEKGDLAAAVVQAERNTILVKESAGPASLDYAQALTIEAEIYGRQGRINDAAETYRGATEAVRLAPQANKRGRMIVNLSAARFFVGQNSYFMALPLYEAAVADLPELGLSKETDGFIIKVQAEAAEARAKTGAR